MSGASPEMKPTAVLVAELAPTGDPDADPRVAVAVLRPLVAQHDGVMVDLPGRRVAVQFSSAFAAVNCAGARSVETCIETGWRTQARVQCRVQ